MKTYAEKLKDPRWQKMRLDVMNRDGFECKRCFSSDKTLNVHHLVYEKGHQPWEYDMFNLVTLCEDCHIVAEDKTALRWFRLFMTTGFQLDVLVGVAKSLAMYGMKLQSTGESFDPEEVPVLIHAAQQRVYDDGYQQGKEDHAKQLKQDSPVRASTVSIQASEKTPKGEDSSPSAYTDPKALEVWCVVCREAGPFLRGALEAARVVSLDEEWLVVSYTRDKQAQMTMARAPRSQVNIHASLEGIGCSAAIKILDWNGQEEP